MTPFQVLVLAAVVFCVVFAVIVFGGELVYRMARRAGRGRH